MHDAIFDDLIMFLRMLEDCSRRPNPNILEFHKNKENSGVLPIFNQDAEVSDDANLNGIKQA